MNLSLQKENNPPGNEELFYIQNIPQEGSKDNVIKAAIGYTEQGFTPLPVGTNKKPLLQSWKELQTQTPSTEEARICFSQYSNPQIAILTGINGFAVVDIDDPDLAIILTEYLFEKTYLVGTQHGGLHIYLTEENPSKSSHVIVGIADIKATGGYVVAPPSAKYHHLNEINSLMRVPSAREWAEQTLGQFGYKVNQTQQNVIKHGENLEEKKIQEGERNNFLASIAGSLRYKGLGQKPIAAALKSINETAIEQPLSDKEVESIAKSYSRYPAGNLTSNPIDIPLEVGFQREVNAGELQVKALQDQSPLSCLPAFDLDGYFVKGWSHLLAAYPKTGKTELMVSLCQRWCQLGEKILYFSEEPQGVWMERLKNQPTGLWQNVTLVFALGQTSAEIQARIRSGTETVVVIDTTRNLLQLENENDNSEISRTLTPHIAAARAGSKSIIFIQHTRKGGGEHGHAIAGGHAFMGAVDIALQLDHDPQSTKSSRRLLHGWGRINVITDLLYERSEDGTFRAIGNPSQVSLDELKVRILDVLTLEKWLKTKEVTNELDDPKPSGEQVRRALESLAQEEKIDRDPPFNQGASSGKTYKWGLRPEGEYDTSS